MVRKHPSSRHVDVPQLFEELRWRDLMPHEPGETEAEGMPPGLRGLVRLDDPDIMILCDSIRLMRAAGFDVTTPEGLSIAVAAGRRRAAMTAAHHQDHALARAKAEEHQRLEDERAAKLELRSKVYYARISDRVKIGYSANVKQRMSSLGSVEELLVTEPGGPMLESRRHAQFAALRVHGEWFRYEEPLVEHVARLRDGQSSTSHSRSRC